jgi:hypothetical protein
MTIMKGNKADLLFCGGQLCIRDNMIGVCDAVTAIELLRKLVKTGLKGCFERTWFSDAPYDSS